jgi:hypothetical protein
MNGKGRTSILADIGNGSSRLLKPSRKVACSILIAANRKNGVALACQVETELFHQWP